MPHRLQDLSPTARTFYWYLRAMGAPRDVKAASEESGIPISSIYAVIRDYPQVFHIINERHGQVSLAPDSAETTPHL